MVAVTGVLVVHDGASWLQECLDALSLQTRPLDRLVIVDTGSTDGSRAIADRHARIRQVVGDVVTISAPRGSTFGKAVGCAIEKAGPEPLPVAGQGGPSGTGAQWLWLLHDDSAAAPQALAHLLEAVCRSPSVGVAGPKLVTWQDPSRLLEVGSVVSRCGRRVGGPAAGEPDQGQYDHCSDVLGVSTSGMLIRRDVFDLLNGFDPAFGQFRDDLDLCWRAQLAGHRVVVVPRARLREAAASTNGRRSADLPAERALRRDRRHGRQVALARCSMPAVPFLAIWIAFAALGSAAVLLVAKRPRSAWAALGDLSSLTTPWRPLAARWRARGLRRVRRRDLRSLFAPPGAAFGHALDAIHKGALVGFAQPGDRGAGPLRSLESGPASQDAESPERPDRGAGRRILGHPGFLAVIASATLAAVAWRSLWGTLVPGGPGVAGGELLPMSGNASQLWHSWLDGWHGAGLGNAVEAPPYLPLLSAGAWVVERLPLTDTSTSSAAVLVTWLLVAAIPLSAWTAYLGARAITRAPWPRAWAALAWASLATLTTAVAGGRLGAVAAHILLPLVGAGFLCASRRSSRSPAIFGAAAALVAAGAFNPALAAIGACAALILLLVGRGRTRLNAAVLLLVPIGLLGPWVLRLADDPLLLLAGPGLTVWGRGAAVPWQLELLNPGGPGSYPPLLSAPLVLVGLVALSRRDAGPRMMTVLALLTAFGLALGAASPHLILALAPQDPAGAGGPITAWPGTGLDLAALALVAAALRGVDGIPGRVPASRFGWRRISVWLVVAAAIAGVAAGLAGAGWVGVGDGLSARTPDATAVAAVQAQGPLGSRLLALTRDGDTIGYHLAGAEPGPVVRDLPAADPGPDLSLAAAVQSTVGSGEVAPFMAAQDALADLGVGYVSFRGASTDPLVTQLDATAGMSRLGSNRGQILWRVLPRESAAGPSRLRLDEAGSAPLAPVAVTGDHGRTDTVIGPARSAPPADGRRLVVAEPRGWAAHARVTFAGRPLTAAAGAGQPTYPVPPSAGRLEITLAPALAWWRWGQLGLLVAVLFLAVPSGRTPPRRAP